MSSLVAIVVYPILFLVIYGIADNPMPAAVIALATVQSVQYSFLNQVGDSSMELAQPHWLPTFDNTVLTFPGFPLRGKMKDNYRYNLNSLSTSDTLGIYVILLKTVLMGLAAVGYDRASGNQAYRISFAMASCLVVTAISLSMMTRVKALSRGIINREMSTSESQKGGVRWIWNMQPFEWTLVIFNVISFSVPNQAYDALISIILVGDVLEVSNFAILAVGTALLFAYIVFQVTQENRRWRNVQGGKGKRTKRSVSRSRQWLTLLWMMIFATVSAEIVLFSFSGNTKVVFLAPGLVCVLAICQKGLQAKFNTFLMEYPSDKSSDIVYWSSIFSVAASGPVLTFNWLALSQDHTSPTDILKQNGNLLLVMIGFLVPLACYCTFIDPFLEEGKSMHKEINQSKYDHLE